MTPEQAKILSQFIHRVAGFASDTLTAYAACEKPIEKVLLPAQKTQTGLLNKKELAARLNVSASTVSNLQNEGLPIVKLGRRTLFNYDEVLIWAKDKEIKGRRKTNLRVVR
jgi:excisionase family DNA binding protein